MLPTAPTAPAARDRVVCSALSLEHLARARGFDVKGADEAGRRGPVLK